MTVLADLIPSWDADDVEFIFEQRSQGWGWEDIAYWNNITLGEWGGSRCDQALVRRARQLGISPPRAATPARNLLPDGVQCNDRALLKAIGDLLPSEQRVIVARYYGMDGLNGGAPATQAQCAEYFDLTQPRISQIEAKAKERLADRVAASS